MKGIIFETSEGHEAFPSQSKHINIMANQTSITFITEEELSAIRNAYAKIETVDPESEQIKALNRFVGNLDKASLEILLDAKIKWISSKASTELFLRDCGKSLKTLG